MNFHMSFQRGILRETFETNIAFERFFSSVHPDMFRKIPFGGELFFTRIARVRFYFVVVTFVEIQGIARFAFFATYVACEGWLVVDNCVLQKYQKKKKFCKLLNGDFSNIKFKLKRAKNFERVLPLFLHLHNSKRCECFFCRYKNYS